MTVSTSAGRSICCALQLVLAEARACASSAHAHKHAQLVWMPLTAGVDAAVHDSQLLDGRYVQCFASQHTKNVLLSAGENAADAQAYTRSLICPALHEPAHDPQVHMLQLA